MGDTRFAPYYQRVKQARDPAAAIHALTDEQVVAALAAASRDADPYIANVLASEALNRIRLKEMITTTLGEGVYAVDREGRLTFMNPAAERLLGVTAERLLGHDIHDLIHPPGVAGVPEPCALLRTLRQGETVKADEATFATASGEALPVSVIAAPVLREGDLDGAVVAFQDIRDRKRAEDLLKESERRLASAQEIAHVGSWEWRLADGRIEWSDEMYRIHGLAPGDEPMTPDRFLQSIHADERPEMRRSLERRLREPMPLDQEVRLVRPDGSIRHVHYRGEVLADAEGRATSVIGSAQDVTSRKQTEERLESLLRDRERIMESIPDVLYELSADLRLRGWNRRLVEASGLEPDDLWELPLVSLVPEAERGRMAAAFDACRDGGELELECPLLRVDSASVPFEWRGLPTRDEQGRVVGFLGTARDVAARREAQLQLEQTRERFRLLARATRDTVYDWDLLTDSLWWNDNFWELTRRAPGSLDPDIEFWTNQIHAEDRGRILESLQEALEGEGDSWSDEYRFARADGTYAHVFDRACIMRDGARAVRLVGTMMDVRAHDLPRANGEE